MIYKFIETQWFKSGQNVFRKKKKKRKNKIGRFALTDIKGFCLFVCLFVLIAGNKIMTDCSGIEKNNQNNRIKSQE